MTDYITFDLESTGFNPVVNEIIEIGAWKIKQGTAVEKFSTLVRPRAFIPNNIKEMTGITQDMVEDKPYIEDILPAFFNFCEDLPFLGYNLPFDYDFISNKGNKIGLDFSLKGERRGIDVLALCRHYIKSNKYKLCNMVEYFGIELDMGSLTYHRAEYDAYITKLVYDKFLLGTNNCSVPEVLRPKLLSDNKFGGAVAHGTFSFT